MRLLHIVRLRSLVRRRFQRAALHKRAYGNRRLFFVVPPEEATRVAALLNEARVEEALEQLAEARWECAEVRYG